jgi:phosphohistidine phosphatase
MTLWIVRHGKAVPRSLRVRDAARFRSAVRGLRRLGARFDLLLHSPWLRAIETADILAPLVRGETAVTPFLAAPPDAALLDELRGGSVAVVGHEPWLSELASLLLFGTEDSASRLPLRKGGVLRLEGAPEPGGMVLTGAFAPRDLDALAR